MGSAAHLARPRAGQVAAARRPRRVVGGRPDAHRLPAHRRRTGGGHLRLRCLRLLGGRPQGALPADIPLGNLGYFAYSPAFAQFVSLFGGLPWWVFSFLLTALLFGTLVWLGGRWALAWLCFVPVVIELYHGNIHLLIGAAIVLGFRHSWTWAFVLAHQGDTGRRPGVVRGAP